MGSLQKVFEAGVRLVRASDLDFPLEVAGRTRTRYSWEKFCSAIPFVPDYPMHPLESYLRDLHDIRSTGAAVKETSYYPPLANLLDAVGQTLKPRVRCVINLKNQGAGMPDGGLFTPDQLQRGADVPLEGQPPARGAIECKGAKDDASRSFDHFAVYRAGL